MAVVKWYDELSDEEVAGIVEVFNTTFSHANPAGKSLFRTPESWKERYGWTGKVQVAMVKKGGKVIGTTVVTYKKSYINGELEPVAFIDDVAVLPEHQGRGHGKEVFLAAMDAIADEAPSGAVLYTSKKIKAWRMYRKNGFEDFASPHTAIKVLHRGRYAGILGGALGILAYVFPKSTGVKEEVAEALTSAGLKDANDAGREFNLFTPLNEKYLARTKLLRAGTAFVAASVRTIHSIKKGKTERIGHVSTIIYSDATGLEKLVKAATYEIKKAGACAAISQFFGEDVKRAFKKAGYTVLGGITGATAMGKPIDDGDFLNKLKKGRLYAPLEHMLGDW